MNGISLKGKMSKVKLSNFQEQLLLQQTQAESSAKDSSKHSSIETPVLSKQVSKTQSTAAPQNDEPPMEEVLALKIFRTLKNENVTCSIDTVSSLLTLMESSKYSKILIDSNNDKSHCKIQFMSQSK